jgi:hypothetical protein
MHTPQIIYLCLVTADLGFHIAKHGEPKDGKFSAISSLMSSAIILSLLYWGGFFTN